MLSSRFEEALVYANAVHASQRRKSSSIPYIGHLLGVTSIVLDYGGDEDEAIAALLHDAPEDQGGLPRLEEIYATFGDRVGDIVRACSDSLESDRATKAPWKERKDAYHLHLRKTHDQSVLLVSAADKLHNARATVADLRRIGPRVWDRFNGGRENALWNYEQLIEAYDATATDDRVKEVVAELKRVVPLLHTT